MNWRRPIGIAGTVPSAIARLTVRGSHPRASAASAREMVPLLECMISVIVIEYSFSLYPCNLGCIKKHIPILTRVQEPEVTPRYTGVQHNESVSTPLHIEETSAADGALVYFGPIDPESKRQLAIPSTFERQISDQELGLKLTLSCVFTGEKVEVSRLLISSDNQGNISSRVLAQLGLPSLIREVTMFVVPNSEFWVVSKNRDSILEVTSTNFAYLAQVYWLEHVSHGSPRQELMKLLGIPRSTCNLLLRKIKDVYLLPTS